jgi:polyisoprenoid-binding protein YceI
MAAPRFLILLLPALALALGHPLRLPAAAVELRMDPARSHVYAVTHGADLFGAQGAEHVIAPTEWSATLCLDPQRPTADDFTFVVDVPARALRVDAEDARGFSGISGADAATAARLQELLLGPGGIDAARYPDIHYAAGSVVHNAGENPLVGGALTLRGKTLPLHVAVDFAPARDGAVHITCHFVLRQSDLGIRVQAVNGVTEVADGLDVYLDLWARPTGKGCSGSPPATGTAGASGASGGSPG